MDRPQVAALHPAALGHVVRHLDHLRPVVEAVQPLGIIRAGGGDVERRGSRRGRGSQKESSPALRIWQDLTVHECRGDGDLELVEGEFAVHLFPQDECVDQAQVNEVIKDPLVPLL